MLVEVSRNASSPYTGRRAPWRGYKRNCDQQSLMPPFLHMWGSSKLMRSMTCTVNIGLTAHTGEEAVDTAAEDTTKTEEAMSTATTVSLHAFVDPDREETTVEVGGGTKGPARGDTISIES